MLEERFILPAGLMPPIVRLSDFYLYDDLITGRFSKTSAIAGGFEYYFVISQDPEKINTSPIGGKIRGVHGPWTRMNQYKGLYPKLMHRILFKPPVSTLAHDGIINTIKFAHSVKASYVVFHTSELDLDNPESEVKEISKMCLDLNLKLFLENEGKAGLEGIFKGKPYPNWHSEPLPLFKKFGVPVVFDPATVEINSGSINSGWNNLVHFAGGKINEIVGHVHLNEYLPILGSDHGTMKSPHYKELLRQISQSGYNGLFTFEVTGVQSEIDKILSLIFAAAAFSKATTIFPNLSKWYGRFSQKNLYDSVKFCKKYLISSSDGKPGEG